MSKPTLFMLLAALSMMLPAIPALAKDTSRVISVETQDLSGGHMALKASHQEISAGEVTFVAKNLTDKGAITKCS